MTENDDLREPAPAWLTIDHIELELLANTLGIEIEKNAPELTDELFADQLKWILDLDDLDDEGWMTIPVIRKSTGEEVFAAQCHWTALTRRR